MANKKFTDYTNKATAAGSDIPLIVDPSDNTTKRTTVAGLAPAIATSFANGAVSGAKLTDSTIAIAKLDTTSFTKFSVYRSSSWSMSASTATLLIHDTKLYDTASAYNATTGIFTAPVTGVYTFKWRVKVVTNGLSDFSSYLRINSADSYIGDIVVISNQHASSLGAVDVALTAGNTVQVYAIAGGPLTSTSGGITQCYFMGRLVP